MTYHSKKTEPSVDILIKLREELFKKRDEVVSKQYRQAIEWTLKKIDELNELIN